jgi:hypothetical protein
MGIRLIILGVIAACTAVAVIGGAWPISAGATIWALVFTSALDVLGAGDE